MKPVRVLTWNLNHRAAKRAVPSWMCGSIDSVSPHLAIFTEYVKGPDHESFLKDLASIGLSFFGISEAVPQQNQILIASKEPLTVGRLAAPPIHVSVPSNALQVKLTTSGIECLGFRMPAFTGADRKFKRPTWDWLMASANELLNSPAIIAGDFNTAAGDSEANCGDCFVQLTKEGWTHALPAEGCSFRHSSGSERCIDHIFVSPSLVADCAEYTWDFREHCDAATWNVVGTPDHAMLLARVAFKEKSTSPEMR